MIPHRSAASRKRRRCGFLAKARIDEHASPLEEEVLGPAQALGIGPLVPVRRVEIFAECGRSRTLTAPAGQLLADLVRADHGESGPLGQVASQGRLARPPAGRRRVPGRACWHGSSSSARAKSQRARARVRAADRSDFGNLGSARASCPPPCRAPRRGRPCRTAAASGLPRRPRREDRPRLKDVGKIAAALAASAPWRGKRCRRSGSAWRNRSSNSMQSTTTQSSGGSRSGNQ